VNHQIRAPKIRVVLEDGGMLGVLSPYEALKEAERRGLDLVEISPKAQPPVCKIMDYGKFKYELKKKAQGSRKSQTANVVKEVSLSPSTDVHDLNFKMRNSQRFLQEGYRVKVGIRFRGREMAHQELGHAQMSRVIESLKDFGTPENNPKMEGRVLAALFAPISQVAKSAKPATESKPATSQGNKVPSAPKNERPSA
jgi:translation initiation factor IF-3